MKSSASKSAVLFESLRASGCSNRSSRWYIRSPSWFCVFTIDIRILRQRDPSANVIPFLFVYCHIPIWMNLREWRTKVKYNSLLSWFGICSYHMKAISCSDMFGISMSYPEDSGINSIRIIWWISFFSFCPRTLYIVNSMPSGFCKKKLIVVDGLDYAGSTWNGLPS